MNGTLYKALFEKDLSNEMYNFGISMNDVVLGRRRAKHQSTLLIFYLFPRSFTDKSCNCFKYNRMERRKLLASLDRFPYVSLTCWWSCFHCNSSLAPTLNWSTSNSKWLWSSFELPIDNMTIAHIICLEGSNWHHRGACNESPQAIQLPSVMVDLILWS